jgi:hypothetical protein
MEVGTLLWTKTTTKDDVFGEVLWEVVATGLPAPEKERKGQMDGVKCVMMGGTGKAARRGYKVIDSEDRIARKIAEGVTVVVPEDKKAGMLGRFAKPAGGCPNNGVVEV